MIVAEQKPLDELYAMIQGYNKVLVLGCGTCVTVCFAGGLREVGMLASTLRIKSQIVGDRHEFAEAMAQRRMGVPRHGRRSHQRRRRGAVAGVRHRCPGHRGALPDKSGASGAEYQFPRGHDGPRRVGGALRGLRQVRARQDRRRLPDCAVHQGPA